MSRYGPQKTCQVCRKFVASPITIQEGKAICSQTCEDKYIFGLLECIKHEQERYKMLDDCFAKGCNERSELLDKVQKLTFKEEWYKESVDKWQKQLSDAGVPSGDNLTLRLEYLIEEHYIFKKFVPKLAMVLMDEDED